MLQCFNPFPRFPDRLAGHPPRLKYSCKTLESHIRMPRTLHMHKDLAEVVFIRFGKGRHRIGGRKYRTQKGDLLVYNAGVVHDEVSDPEQNLSVFCVGVAGLRLPGLPPNALITPLSPPVLSTDVREEEFRDIFAAIHRHTANPVRFGGDILDGLLRSLVFMVLGLETDSLRGEEEGEHALLTGVKKYIDEHFADALSLASIAAEFGMSRHYLSHLFKDREGLSPMRYIIRRRIGEAQSLLIHTDRSVTAIAYAVGYNNANHFHVAFQKIVGLSPANYRKYWVTGETNAAPR
jgi:AraC-like DNA-binding protein